MYDFASIWYKKTTLWRYSDKIIEERSTQLPQNDNNWAVNRVSRLVFEVINRAKPPDLPLDAVGYTTNEKVHIFRSISKLATGFNQLCNEENNSLCFNPADSEASCKNSRG